MNSFELRTDRSLWPSWQECLVIALEANLGRCPFMEAFCLKVSKGNGSREGGFFWTTRKRDCWRMREEELSASALRLFRKGRKPTAMYQLHSEETSRLLVALIRRL